MEKRQSDIKLDTTGLRNYDYQYVEPPLVLHRTANRIIIAGGYQKVKSNLDGQLRGWKSPVTAPYQPIGVFQKVVPVIEELKTQLEHSLELQALSQKQISEIKRNNDSLYVNGENPRRTWHSISRGIQQIRCNKNQIVTEGAQGKRKNNEIIQRKNGADSGKLSNHIDLKEVAEGDNKSIKDRMINLERQFNKIPLNQQQLDASQDIQEEVVEPVKEKLESNKMLYSPSLKKIIQKKDASVMLKGEIGESQLRLQAAKFGHTIDEIVPEYQNSFYLPAKDKFRVLQTQENKHRQSIFNQTNESSVCRPISRNNCFQSQAPIQNKSSTFESTFIKNDQSTSCQSPQPKLTKSFVVHQSVFKGTIKYKDIIVRGYQENYCQPQKTKRQIEQQEYQKQVTKWRNNLDPQEKIRVTKLAGQGIQKLVPHRPSHINEISERFHLRFDNQDAVVEQDINKAQESVQYDQEYLKSDNIQFISSIDSKPVHPTYLKLLPLRKFIKYTNAQKSYTFGQVSQTQRGQKNEQTVGGAIRSIERTEYDEIIKSLQGCKMLENDLKNCIQKWVDEPARAIQYRRRQLEQIQKSLMFLASSAVKKDDQTDDEESQNLLKIPNSQLTAQDAALKKFVESQQAVLTKQQDQLLSKLIYFDTLVLDGENDAIKHKLYDLFFIWRGKEKNQKVDNHEEDEQPQGEQSKKDKEDKIEREKRAQLKRDQAMQEFQDRGGFSRVLNDLFNPTDSKGLELDSVFQIKKFCREFYERKTKLSKELLETLDALNNARPNVLKLKRKHFDLEKFGQATQREQLEWMRLNAEKDRVNSYKQLALEHTKFYYNILEKFVKMLDERKQKDMLPYTKDKSTSHQQVHQFDFQQMTEKLESEARIMMNLNYITEFMRQVVEQGTGFNQNHLFILLLNLDVDQINESSDFLKVIVQLLKVNKSEMQRFIDGLSDPNLKSAYQSIEFEF